MRFAAALAAALFVALCGAGCSSVKPWINQPLQADERFDPRATAQRDPSALFAVTLSG